MSAKGAGDQPVTRGGYSAGGSLVAYPRPDEVVVPLRREEFDTLCEGGVSEEKASRDLFIGAGFGALVGLVGVLATTDWDTAWKLGHRGWFLFFLLVLCAMGAGSVAGAFIYQSHLKRTSSNSAFSRLRARLLGLFSEPRTLDAAVEKLPSAVSKQISGPLGVRWENAASLFWLGHDLSWTVQTVRSAAPKERIIHGLTQSYHQLSQLGLADSFSGKLLSSLRSQAESTPEAAFSQQWRDDFAGKLASVIRDVSDLARSQQPDYQTSPKQNAL